LVLIISTINENDGTIAQARPLEYDSATDRATIGFLEINFNEMINE